MALLNFFQGWILLTSLFYLAREKIASLYSACCPFFTELIDTMGKAAQGATDSVAQGEAEINAGVATAANARGKLEDIRLAVQQVDEQMTHLAKAAQEMDESSNVLTQVMGQVSSIAGENAQAMEQIAAGGEEVMAVIEGVAAIAVENSSSAEEVSANTEEVSAQVSEVAYAGQTLTQMAARLVQALGSFRLGNEDHGHDLAAGMAAFPQRAVLDQESADWSVALPKHPVAYNSKTANSQQANGHG